MDPWSLIKGCKFSQALEAFGVLVHKEPSRPAHYRGLGLAYLNLGKPQEARNQFQEAMNRERKPSPEGPGRYLSDHDMLAIGVTYWIEGDHNQAGQLWFEMTEALREDRVDYTDAPGGVGAGLLLWFAGARLGIPEWLEAVARLYRQLSKRNTWGGLNGWPGPVAKYFLDAADARAFLAAVSEVPVLRERQLCQANFAIAVRSLQEGRSADYQKLMRKAAESPWAYLEDEYYLAKYESLVT